MPTPLLVVSRSCWWSVQEARVVQMTHSESRLFTVKSRVLMSIRDEGEELDFGPHPPFSYKDLLSQLFSFAGASCSQDIHLEPPSPHVEATPARPSLPMEAEPTAPTHHVESVTTVTESVTTVAANVNTNTTA